MSQKSNNLRVFLIWPREYALSQNLAEALGLKIVLIQAKNERLPFWIRYVSQSFRTLAWLIKNKPTFVFIQNPPLMAGLTVYFFSLFHPKTKFGFDNHSVFFREKKWQSFHFLYKPIAKRALINTAHNRYDLDILKKWEVKCQEMQFINPVYNPEEMSAPLNDPRGSEWETRLAKAPISVFYTNRFAKSDDDYLTVIETARKRPEWLFFITGETKKVSKAIIKNASPNIIFTGYLEHSDFLKLMNRCDVALALTLREKTVLWSVRETMALKKAFVISDTKALREYFGTVGIFAKREDANDLLEKIQSACQNKEGQQEKIKEFLKKDNHRVEKELAKLKKKIYRKKTKNLTFES